MSAGRHAVHPRFAIPGWLAFLVVGSSAVVVTTLAASGWIWLPGLVQSAGVGATVVGIVRHGQGNRSLWWVIVAGGAGWTVATGVARASVAVGEASGLTTSELAALVPAWSDLLLLVSYATVAIALVLLTRQPGERAANAVDALIISAALLVLIWTFGLRPLLATPWSLSLGTALGLGHAAISGVMVVAVLRLSASERESRVAAALLSIAGLALVLADVAVAAPLAGPIGVTDVATVAAQAWPITLGAASLHPCSVQLWSGSTLPGGTVSRRRFAAFILLALVVPATPLGVALLAERAGQRADALAYAPTTLVAVAVSVLMVVRLGLIARVAERQAHDLRRSLRQRSALERELRHRATHDPLTGLASRAVLLDGIERALDGAPASGTLVIINLDGFKDVNDAHGHDVGDQVLVQVAQRIRGAARETDVVARLGGDEFAMLCPAASDGAERAELALQALRAGYPIGDHEVHLTATAGLLDLTPATSSTAALRDADLALTAAKDMGKNRSVTFDPSMRADRVQRSELACGLRKALAERRLSVHYQPVVRLADGRMDSVEALVRWVGDDGEQIPPMRFIPVAEQTGLIVEMGEFVLRRACSDALPWHERYGIAVTVNVSAHQLRQGGFVEAVLDVISETGLPARALVLELTETTMITDLEETTALERLRAYGVRVAVDDFGTGYSSLSYLFRLPVDLLKIDRTFTSPTSKSVPNHWAFVRAILDLANSLHLVTIAEGVETDQQAHTLRNLGCPLAQGFLYSRPVPSSAITELLAAWNGQSPTPRLEPETPAAPENPRRETPAARPDNSWQEAPIPEIPRNEPIDPHSLAHRTATSVRPTSSPAAVC